MSAIDFAGPLQGREPNTSFGRVGAKAGFAFSSTPSIVSSTDSSVPAGQRSRVTRIATMLIEALERDESRIARTGADAIAAARAAGVPVYYVDRSIGEGIISHDHAGSMISQESTASCGLRD